MNVADRVSGGDTSALIHIGTTSDTFYLGTLVTSIATVSPLFTDTQKTVVDVNGGDLRKGDVLQYKIATHNGGTDVATQVVMQDVLQPGLQYVPGSLQVLSGANAGPLTDAAGDDVGEYDSSTSTVRVRLGEGATASAGGAMAIDERAIVQFEARINVDQGTVSNQATVLTVGQKGATPAPFLSDGTGNGSGTPTSLEVDQCSSNSDCPESFVCERQTKPNHCVQSVKQFDVGFGCSSSDDAVALSSLLLWCVACLRQRHSKHSAH